MSMLEDIFLHDEANEAEELERVIEGDEFEERPRSPNDDSDDNERRDDEAEEDKRRVDPTSNKPKRVTKNPRFLLNPARLTGPRGIQVIPEHFKDFKFKGKGHEKEDLDMVLKKLEHWAYRLYPKFQFQDCLKKIETLGKKRPVMVHLQKIRSDQFISEETVVQKDSSDDEAQPPQEVDEFDKLLQEQIELARATPAPGSVKKVVDKNDQWEKVLETPNRGDRSFHLMPKATSSPSISDEQKERMARNRKLAEERRLARLKATTSIENNVTNTIIEVEEGDTSKVGNEANNDNDVMIVNDSTSRKSNRNNVIDSSDSDDESNVMIINESVAVDIHGANGKISDEAPKVISNDVVEIGDSNDDKNKISDDLNNQNTNVDISEKNIAIVDNIEKMLDRNGDNIEKMLDRNGDNHEVTNQESIELSNTDQSKNIDSSVENDTSNKIIEENDNSNKLEEGKQVTESINNDKELCKETLPGSDENNEKSNVDDIMDVDFTDDF